MKKQEFRDYLINNSTIDKETGCWNWDRSLNSSGYGIVFRNKIEPYRRAHRLSYIVFKGVIPKGLCVCHHCDNPKCINPEHLFLGTNQDNVDDKMKKGRWKGNHLKGEDSPWWGRKHKQESKDKIGRANSLHQQGKGNNQYGTCWIYNLELKENKKIAKFELKEWVNKGWIKGRKMVF